jgi:predicted Na+-dependent transporter
MAVGLLLSLAMIQAFSISSLFSLTSKQKRSIVSEVGIQNAVQGVAIAAMIAENVETSRFALPSVVYALAMYPAVSAYVFYVRNRG